MSSRDDLFKTLVFTDFETTGLFRNSYSASHSVTFSSNDHVLYDELRRVLDWNSPAPKMTEFAFLETSMDDFRQSIRSMNQEFRQVGRDSSIETFVPGTMLTEKVNPRLSESEWYDYEVRRHNSPDVFVHSKRKLLEKNDFATEWSRIEEFLENLYKPACLVAHNGIGFDYRVLYDAVHELGESIPDGIYFVDSLLAFKKIEHDQFARGNADTPALRRRRRANENSRRSPSFSQKRLYDDIIKNRHVEFHHAPDDAEALAQICLAYGDDFVNYVNNAAALLPF